MANVTDPLGAVVAESVQAPAVELTATLPPADALASPPGVPLGTHAAVRGRTTAANASASRERRGMGLLGEVAGAGESRFRRRRREPVQAGTVTVAGVRPAGAAGDVPHVVRTKMISVGTR